MARPLPEQDPVSYNRNREAYRNNDLLEARKKLGLSLKNVACETGITYSLLFGYERGIFYPRVRNQIIICDFYRKRGVYILEEEIFPILNDKRYKRRALKEGRATEEDLISLDWLKKHPNHPLIPTVDNKEYEISRQEAMQEAVAEIMMGLSEEEQTLLKMRFGLEDGIVQEYDKIAKIKGCTRSNVHMRVFEILKKLRHPVRLKIVEKYLGDNLFED